MPKEPGPKPHIVVIEDNPSDIFLIRLALEDHGRAFRLTTFQNGADALLALCPAGNEIADGLHPDLILLDLNTPCCDGFEVLAGIRENANLAAVPVAILTSSDSPADQLRASDLGAACFVQKGCQLAAFMSSVVTVVEQLLPLRSPGAPAGTEPG